MSDLASLVSYQYPVHQISADYKPLQAGETLYLVVYRDTTDEVNFTLVNVVSAHLLNTILQQGVATIDSLSRMMVEAMPQLDVQQITESLQQVLQQLLKQEILFSVVESPPYP
jgi:hypothetical protein